MSAQPRKSRARMLIQAAISLVLIVVIFYFLLKSLRTGPVVAASQDMGGPRL